MDTLYITPRAQKWLQITTVPRILNCFQHVTNLANQQGDILSVAHPTVPLTPLTVQVPGTVMLPDSTMAAIAITPGAFGVNGALVPLDRHAVWSPQPPWPALRRRAFAIMEPAGFENRLVAGVRRVLEGLRAADSRAVGIGVAALIGRGPGLTPAGDDMLCGILYALRVWYPRATIVPDAVAAALTQTTTLSAALLRAALAGEATAPWHTLTAAADEGRKAILNIGASSGPAAWYAFVQTARVFREETAV